MSKQEAVHIVNEIFTQRCYLGEGIIEVPSIRLLYLLLSPESSIHPLRPCFQALLLSPGFRCAAQTPISFIAGLRQLLFCAEGTLDQLNLIAE